MYSICYTVDVLDVALSAALDVLDVVLDVVVYVALHVPDVVLDILDAVLHVALHVLDVVLDVLVLNAVPLCRRRFLTRTWMLVSEVFSPSWLEMYVSLEYIYRTLS